MLNKQEPAKGLTNYIETGTIIMKILSIRPLEGPGAVARFDVEINEHLRLFSLNLRRTPDGRWRTYAANSCGKHVASFHPDLAEKITTAAVAAMNGGSAAYARH